MNALPRNAQRHVKLLLMLFTASMSTLGCGGSEQSSAAPVQSDGDSNATPPIMPDGASSIQPTDCTFVFKRPPNNIGIIGTPQALTNSPSYCDYYVAETLQFKNTVTIEPGTVIAFAPTVGMRIRDGGKLIAVGKASERIVFRGLELTSNVTHNGNS